MAAYFFDSSAIVKRYLKEAGTAWIVSLADPSAQNDLFVATITGIEVVSAIVRRNLGGDIDAPTAAAALAQFRYDFRNQYQTIAVSDAVVARAMALAEVHGLRAYDAVQLAAILETCAVRRGLPLPSLIIVSADQQLNMAAYTEGMTVEDPNNHP